jgi:hypothetical protein
MYKSAGFIPRFVPCTIVLARADCLTLAALRDHNSARTRDILQDLHRRVPDNELYTRETDRIDKGG